MLRMNQEEEKNVLINSITRDDPKMRARAFFVEALAKRTGNH